ncbi:MAG: hypothetical protein NXI13_06245 [Proteobacteria bacterium]|nr:hypothetical protein [Pseudomonadota bacterium]
MIFAMFLASLLVATQLKAEETVTQNEIKEHVESLLAGIPPKYGKWGVPIRYQVIGELSDLEVSSFDSIMAYLGKLTEVQVEKVNDDSANFIVIYTNDYVTLSKNPDIQNIFKNKGETTEEFEKRLLEANDDPVEIVSISKRWSDKEGNVGGFAVLDNPYKSNEPVSNLYMNTIVNGFLMVSRSDVVQPSIFGSKGLSTSFFDKPALRLPYIDEALFIAMYEVDFSRADDQQEIVERLTERMVSLLSRKI